MAHVSYHRLDALPAQSDQPRVLPPCSRCNTKRSQIPLGFPAHTPARLLKSPPAARALHRRSAPVEFPALNRPQPRASLSAEPEIAPPTKLLPAQLSAMRQ